MEQGYKVHIKIRLIKIKIEKKLETPASDKVQIKIKVHYSQVNISM